MPPVIALPATDLLLPSGRDVDPYTVHTYYFGFSVPEAALGAFVYLRCQPAFGLSQGGVSIFRGLDNPEPLDVEYHDYRTTMPWPIVDDNLIRVENGLQIEVVTSGQLIRLRYRSPDGNTFFELEQSALTPLLARGHIMPGEEDHHAAADLAPGGIEQFMACTGRLVLRGEAFDVDCSAVRDRSWNQVRREDPGGARPSPPLGWTPMRFGPDLALNAVSIEAADTEPPWREVYQVPAGAPESYYAWLVRDGEPRWLSSVHREVLERDAATHVATRQRLEVVDDAGDKYAFSGEAVALAAVAAWPNVAFHDSLYRWTDEHGRQTHCTYQEIWFDGYQREMKRRSRELRVR